MDNPPKRNYFTEGTAVHGRTPAEAGMAPKGRQPTEGPRSRRGKQREGRNSREKPRHNLSLSVPSQKDLSINHGNNREVLNEKLSLGKGEKTSIFSKHIHF